MVWRGMWLLVLFDSMEVRMVLGVDKLFEIGDFRFAAHVVEGALFDAAVYWVFGFGWRAIIDIQWRSG